MKLLYINFLCITVVTTSIFGMEKISTIDQQNTTPFVLQVKDDQKKCDNIIDRADREIQNYKNLELMHTKKYNSANLAATLLIVPTYLFFATHPVLCIFSGCGLIGTSAFSTWHLYNATRTKYKAHEWKMMQGYLTDEHYDVYSANECLKKIGLNL